MSYNMTKKIADKRLGSLFRKSQFRPLVEAALKAGWTVNHTKNCHVVFRSPDKTQPQIICPNTPSDRRASKNLRSQLRRAGLEV